MISYRVFTVDENNLEIDAIEPQNLSLCRAASESQLRIGCLDRDILLLEIFIDLISQWGYNLINTNRKMLLFKI